MEQQRPKLLRMEEVQEITGLGRATCYARVAAGDFPHVRFGRSVRVPLHALEAWIERNTSGGNHDAA